MSQLLSTGSFENLSFPNMNNYPLNQVVEDALQIPDNNENGFVLECDLGSPAKIKQKTENFPFYPYQTEVNPNLFNEYIKSVKQAIYKPTTQLVCFN